MLKVRLSVMKATSNLAGLGQVFWDRCRHAIPARSDCREPAVVNVSTGEILSSVNTSKTILPMKFRPGFSALLTTSACWKGSGLHLERTRYAVPDVGYRNGVIFLINDGIDRGLWDLQNKQNGRMTFW